MRIVLVNYGHFAEHATPEAVLDDFRTLTGWAEGLAAAGAEVAVVQGFRRDAGLERGGVDYRFVAGRFAPVRRWRLPLRLHRAVRALAPDVVHLNGLLFALQARALRRRLPAGCALVLQHHGAKPDRGFAAVLQRWGLAAADGFFFTGRESAAPWRTLIRPRQPVFEIMEGSSRFRLQDLSAARAVTGARGRPVFLWAGNLDANKDPLTVLDGFEKALAELPEARLYMAYRGTALLEQVRERVAAGPALGRAVELVGTVAYPDMEAWFASADFLLQGSRYEGSGYALADAMACGAVPVVTDIAPFRFITANGEVGALWPAGDARALAAAILALARRPLDAQRRAARELFDRRLSYEAICRDALAAYRQLLDGRRRIGAAT